MITNEDLTKIATTVVEAHKEVFPTKDDFDSLRGDFSKLQSSVDAFVKITKKNEDEILVINNRVGNHEDWIRQAGPRIGLEFIP